MPKFDGTGPMGQGPRTGRGLGNCPSVGTEAVLTKEEQKKLLLEEKEIIEQKLAALK